ncbi:MULTISPECIES: YqaA family protein [Pseudomonas putida group]|uniref:DedA family protein n=1 Tax=Pseudomonas putida TaxID=303 RepID=A0ABD7BJW5_PSEPU|nr:MULTISPECIES: YqaA family protein [Pseudomonas putida group]MCL8301787.1 DedA family protein [Pseudomonas mosselii]MCL8341861.1 DedA family protein [Pseudomonas mosselii]QOD01001.1 DedA family protein [Pseudomonas putida]WJR31441.1 YqaA family protein [Pseudomonas mosselii]
MLSLGSYLGLFLAALGAATLLPMQSEAVLAGMLVSEYYDPLLLLTVATLGNVLGSAMNWLLGLGVERYRNRRWFPVGPDKLQKAQNVYHRYGYWSLLLSWVPLIGDPLTLVAGIMREPLWRFLLVVSVAKGGRYLILTMLVLGSMP